MYNIFVYPPPVFTLNDMIPKIKDLELPLLRLLAQKSPLSWDDCTLELSELFHLSMYEKNQMMPNGKCGAMKYRVGWAKANLKKAGLVEAPCRGVYAITEQGIDYLETMA